jgi:hypothetical protein
MRGLDRPRFEHFRRRWLANDPEAMAAILRMSTNPAFDLSADLAPITAPTPGDRLHATAFARRRW